MTGIKGFIGRGVSFEFRSRFRVYAVIGIVVFIGLGVSEFRVYRVGVRKKAPDSGFLVKSSVFR